MDAALDYAARGYRVLPLHTPDPAAPTAYSEARKLGGCSCRRADCGSAGKHPRTPRGVHDATTDPATIRRWWTLRPDANVGIACGDGLIVLDVDPRHGGGHSLAQLEAEHGEIRTLTARTGGDGLHLNLAGKLPARSAFLPGLDLKAAGGFVVAPPSLHASGRRYQWVAPDDLPTEPQPVPAWLAEIVAPKVERRALTDRPVDVPVVHGSRYIARAIEAECITVATAPAGTRNTTLNIAAFNLARFVAADEADAAAVAHALTIAAEHAGLRGLEIELTIKSAFSARRAA